MTLTTTWQLLLLTLWFWKTIECSALLQGKLTPGFHFILHSQHHGWTDFSKAEVHTEKNLTAQRVADCLTVDRRFHHST